MVKNLRPVDGVSFLYICANLLLLVFQYEKVEKQVQALLAFGGLLAVQFIILFLMSPERKISMYLRDWYPILFSAVYYPAIGFMNQSVVQGTFDAWLIRLEEGMFGMQPALDFSRYFDNLVLYEIMNLFYFFYYFFIFIAGYLLAKKDEEIFRRLIFSVALMATLQFYFFTLFPTAGPKFAFPELAGSMHLEPRGPFSLLMYHILDSGEIAGAAFPSSHVSVALMSVLFVQLHRGWRYSWWLWIMFVGLFFSTIYTRQHYAIDAIFGAVYSLLAWKFTGNLYEVIGRLQRNLVEISDDQQDWAR